MFIFFFEKKKKKKVVKGNGKDFKMKHVYGWGYVMSSLFRETWFLHLRIESIPPVEIPNLVLSFPNFVIRKSHRFSKTIRGNRFLELINIYQKTFFDRNPGNSFLKQKSEHKSQNSVEFSLGGSYCRGISLETIQVVCWKKSFSGMRNNWTEKASTTLGLPYL